MVDIKILKQKINNLEKKPRVEITRQDLNKGMQGRIKVREIEQYNKSNELKLAFYKRELLKLNRSSNVNNMIEEETTNFIDKDFFTEPKLKKVRDYHGWV